MKTLGLCLLAGLSLSACATGMSPADNSVDGAMANQVNLNSNIATQYPVEMAMLNIYTKPFMETLYTSSDELKIAASFQTTPKGAVTFNGEPVQASQTLATTIVNGQVVDKSLGVDYYTFNPLVFRGFTSDKEEYSIATQTQTIPKIAKVGQSSTYLTENVYSDSSQSQQVNRYTQSWSLSQASTNTAWLCIDSSENLLLDVDPEGAVSECYRINEKGDILDSKIAITYQTDNGVEVVNFSRG